MRSPKPVRHCSLKPKTMTQEARGRNHRGHSGPEPACHGKGRGEIGQIGPVQVEMLEGLDVLIIRGHKRDVEQVMNVIKQVEQLSTKTEPPIEIYKLKYIDCQALAELITPALRGSIFIAPGKREHNGPGQANALLIVGRKENVKTAIGSGAAAGSAGRAGNAISRLSFAAHVLVHRVDHRDRVLHQSIAADWARKVMVSGRQPIKFVDYSGQSARHGRGGRFDRPPGYSHQRSGKRVAGDSAANIRWPATWRRSFKMRSACKRPRRRRASGRSRRHAGAQPGQAARPATAGTSEQRSAVLRFLRSMPRASDCCNRAY